MTTQRATSPAPADKGWSAPNEGAALSGGPRSRPLQTYLVLLALVLMAPLLILIAVLIHREAEHIRSEARYGLELAAEGLVRDLDETVMQLVPALLRLAQIPSAHEWTSDDLVEHVRRSPSLAAVDLFLHDGRGLVTAAATVSRLLGPHTAPLSEHELQQLRGGAFAISVRLPKAGALTERIRITVSVLEPKLSATTPAALLSAEVPTSQLRSSFDKLPAGMVGSIIDGSGNSIVSTGFQPTQPLGMDADMVLRSARSNASDWSVIVGRRSSDLDAEARLSLWLWFMASIALVLGSCAGAMLLGRRLAEPIVRLAEDARALEEARIVAQTSSGVLEVDQVSLALARASARRQQHSQELHLGEQRFRALAQMSPVVIFHTDVGGRVTYINDRVCELTGRSALSVLATEWQDLVDATERDRVGALWQSCVAVSKPFKIELRLSQFEGRTPWVLAEALPELDDQGRVVGYVGALVDLTERKLSETKLAGANVELERCIAERTTALAETVERLQQEVRYKSEALGELTQSRKLEVLGQLAGGIAHDFNNVLMAISGNLDLIEVRAKADPALTRFTQNGKAAVVRASRLADQILTFSRREPVTPEVIDLAQQLREFDDVLRNAVTSSIELRIAVPDETWPIWAEPAALQTALLNIMLNARDAIREGGTVALTARNSGCIDIGRPACLTPDGEYVVINIADSGTGMTADVLARASEPFFTTKSAGKGTGLGLAMVQNFVETANGALAIDSAPGKGTRVSLYLPRARRQTVSRRAKEEQIAAGGEAHGTLLVVDDDEQARVATSDLLREIGYTVIEASNAATGHAYAHAITDLVLVVADIAMPGLGGRELAARLRSERPDLPVLLITGHDVDGDGAKVLRKPFTAVALASKVHDMIASRNDGRGSGHTSQSEQGNVIPLPSSKRSSASPKTG